MMLYNSSFEQFLDEECARSTEEIMANVRQEDKTPCPFEEWEPKPFVTGQGIFSPWHARYGKTVWNKGKKYKGSPRPELSERNMNNDHAKGALWYNNGVECKRSKTPITDPGWVRGRLISDESKKKMHAHLNDLIRNEKGQYVGRK